MPIQQLPGQTGFFLSRMSSMDKRAIGKFTDRNHLGAFHPSEAMDYDKKIINLYTQTRLYSNDFLNMINKSTLFEVDGMSDTWKWGMAKPYQMPTVLSVPDSTLTQTNVGIDGKSFELILDTDEFKKNDVVIFGNRQFGVNLYALSDPRRASGRGFIQEFMLASTNPQNDSVNKQWLKPGMPIQYSHNNIGEFDQDGSGLGKFGDKLELFETLGSGMMFEHTITKWADEKTLKDKYGRPLDILVYGNKINGEFPKDLSLTKWEPFVESELRKKALEAKVSKFIWGKPGTFRTGGGRQELKKESAGIHWRMRNGGNYIPYNRGEFSLNLLKEAFGDIFYRREAIQDRYVKMYTNEAGMDLFDQACKQDAFGSGINFIAQTNALNSGSISASHPSQNNVYSFGFGSMYSRATGMVEVVHLQELDLPQNPAEYGQNKKSTPVFMIFNISPSSDGSLTNNIREVRRAGVPEFTWGWIDGRASHLGPMASQGMSSSSKFPGYTFWLDSRADVFIEDTSSTFLIEELPAY